MREDTQCVTSGFEVTVTFDERRGYVASAPKLRSPVTALSLGGLRGPGSDEKQMFGAK